VQHAGIQGGVVAGASVLDRVIANRAGTTAFGDHIAQRERAPIQVTCNRVFRDFQHIDDGFDFLDLFRTALDRLKPTAAYHERKEIRG